MKKNAENRLFPATTTKGCWGAVLLIFCLFITASLPVRADNQDTPKAYYSAFANIKPRETTFEAADRSYKLNLLMNYIRKQGPSWVPGLPDSLRAPVHMALDGLGSAADEVGLGQVGSAASAIIPPFLLPASSLMTPPSAQDMQELWLSPDYHHKGGVMPFEDALILGFNYRSVMPESGVGVSVHPFYAQSWNSARGYWGTEMSVGFGDVGKQPWGKISVRYNQGNAGLMDKQGGFDVRGDFAFDDHLSLSAGVRQQDNTQLGDYALLRWRMKLNE